MKELPLSYTVGSPGQRQKLSGSPQIPLYLVINHLTVVQRIMKGNKGTPILPDQLVFCLKGTLNDITMHSFSYLSRSTDYTACR